VLVETVWTEQDRGRGGARATDEIVGCGTGEWDVSRFVLGRSCDAECCLDVSRMREWRGKRGLHKLKKRFAFRKADLLDN